MSNNNFFYHENTLNQSVSTPERNEEASLTMNFDEELKDFELDEDLYPDFSYNDLGGALNSPTLPPSFSERPLQDMSKLPAMDDSYGTSSMRFISLREASNDTFVGDHPRSYIRNTDLG